MAGKKNYSETTSFKKRNQWHFGWKNGVQESMAPMGGKTRPAPGDRWGRWPSGQWQAQGRGSSPALRLESWGGGTVLADPVRKKI